LAQGKSLKFSKPILLLFAVLQNAVIFGVAIWLGLLAAHHIGLGAPYLEAVLTGANIPQLTGLLAALVIGVIAGAILLIADLFFVPYWPQKLRDTALHTTFLENLLASFYGGIVEELLMRLFGFSALVWLLSSVWHTAAGGPTVVVLWITNIIMTILFGIGHLPALKLGNMPRLMVVRSPVLNAPVGLVCGWLFWTYGIEAAIIAHSPQISCTTCSERLFCVVSSHRESPPMSGVSFN
jgi:Type II CAAX prenyl endopeptidase Rce1-like